MNVTIVYISHNIEEMRRIPDRIVVMRDGQIVDITDQHAKFQSAYFVEEMAGKDFLNRYTKVKYNKNNVVFKVENLTNEKRTVHNVTMSLYEGEIVGLAGLQGSGKSSVADMIYGLGKSLRADFTWIIS